MRNDADQSVARATIYTRMAMNISASIPPLSCHFESSSGQLLRKSIVYAPAPLRSRQLPPPGRYCLPLSPVDLSPAIVLAYCVSVAYGGLGGFFYCLSLF